MQLELGLRLQLFCLYVDDLRFYLFPIKKGRYWNNKEGWKYTLEQEDDNYCPMKHTLEPLGASLNCIWDFTQFTTESERDFSNGFLATLDCQTKVLDSGVISYKYYSKPMASNLVLQMGTALSRSCVFSSLRQDLVRRMITTSLIEPMTVRLEVINDFIQLLINSDHKYAFIKAVVQQGLTKFEFIKYRAGALGFEIYGAIGHLDN